MIFPHLTKQVSFPCPYLSTTSVLSQSRGVFDSPWLQFCTLCDKSTELMSVVIRPNRCHLMFSFFMLHYNAKNAQTQKANYQQLYEQLKRVT